MPLYEYECFVCGIRFERIQKTTADPTKVCPDCGGAVRRLLGVPALQFKGSGWYVTDYGKGTGGAPGARATDSPEPQPTPATGKTPASSDKKGSKESPSETSKAS